MDVADHSPDNQAVIEMDFLRLIAVVLLSTAIGCAPSRLFSRADAEEDFPLGSRVEGANPVRNREPADAVKGNWNVVQDDSPDSDPTPPVRPLTSLPVSELLARAEVARAHEQLPEARRLLDAILLQQPNHPGAHHRLAVIADLEGRFGDAEHHYKMALHSDGHNPSIIGDLGYSYMLQGRLPLAEEYLLKARSIDPAHGNVSQNLAHLYARKGDLNSAQQVLAEILPPDQVEQQLARMFPGVSLQQAYPAAELPAQRPPTAPSDPWSAPPDQAFAANSPINGPNQPFDGTSPYAQFSPDHRTAMVVAPGSQFAGPDAGPAASPLASVQPNSTTPFAQPGAAAQIGFDSPPHALPSVESAAATGAPAMEGNGAARRWPPPLWPPVSDGGPVSSTAGSVPDLPARPKAGVNYLLPRRSQNAPTPLAHPAPPVVDPAANPRPLDRQQGAPTGNFPSGSANSTTSFPSSAQYSNGPGASRIVTWSNLNGQSIEAPPLPPTDAELQAAANLGLGGAPSSAVLRTSPGSASGWNGGFYPPPQRQFPGDPGAFGGYPQQGAPLRANAPASTGQAPNAQRTPADLPHPGFTIAPEAVMTDNPLAGYEQDRRQFDQQFQQQVSDTYGRSPSGYITPPSASIPAPGYALQPTGPQMQAGPPMTPNGTPWPGRTPDGAVPNALRSAPTSPQSAATNASVPASDRRPRVPAEPIAPPAYRRPSATVAPHSLPAGLPSIVPGA